MRARAYSRRAFLREGVALAGALTVAGSGCGGLSGGSDAEERKNSFTPPPAGLAPNGPLREFRRICDVSEVEVGPETRYRSWMYNGRFPGEEIRVREGDHLRVVVENRLPEGTTIHWHGIPLPNAMDGVPNVTQQPIATGSTFVYEFTANPPGSYLYHSHMGLQADRGLIGPLIVEESTSHVAWDREYVVFFDDFLPEAPRPLSQGGGRPGGGMGRGRGRMGMGMGMMGFQTPPYSGVLINGRLSEGAPVFDVRRGDRVRFRLMNASGSTTFRVAVAGHRMTVSHADGRPVEPVTVDSLEMGSGERYDVIVEAANPGVWALVGVPYEVDVKPARAFLRYQEIAATELPQGQMPEGLSGGRRLTLGDLVSLELDGESDARSDRTFDLLLSGGMMSPRWTINGQAYPDADPLSIKKGERVRVRMTNDSMMPHPMHLHGHFFRVGGALKDTVLVPSFMGRVDFEFLANNPGNWFFHCHNLYHMEAGMARVVRYGA